jgi:hypothetical protein
MTELKRKVTRKIPKPRGLRHPLVVQLDPAGAGILKLREKGARKWYSIGLEELYKRLVAINLREQGGAIGRKG